MNTNQKILIPVALILVIALAVWQFNQPEQTTNSQLSNTEQTDIDSNNEVVVSNFKDGIYTANGRYISPAGNEEVEITITLENNVITAAEFQGFATNPGSVFQQNNFAQGFEQEVIGRPISEVRLNVVNGSSLTPKGFNDALEKIKSASLQS
jgi:uncharacterized protein with FMN-binding domain